MLAQVEQSRVPSSNIDRDCYRPYPPYRVEYATDQEYQQAVSAYYSQATFYLLCLDGYEAELRREYMAMLAQELQGYEIERQDVRREMDAVFAEQTGSHAGD